MDIKEIAKESGAVAYSPSPLRTVRGYSFTFKQLQNFAEALVAELAKGNEPVAWWNGKETAFFEHETDGPVGEVSIPLYTLPPTASQIEQETAEACAKVYLNTYDLTDIAEAIRSGAWKEFKKS